MAGDFNAKLICANGEDEESSIGPFFLKGSVDTFDHTANSTLDNRQSFINMVQELGLMICNTKFENQSKNYAVINLLQLTGRYRTGATKHLNS